MDSANYIVKRYWVLILWVVVLITIGWGIGYFTKPELSVWYSTLNRAKLTPPNYLFPIVWTILYGFIGICGWLIWHSQPFLQLKAIKKLYVMQLILNFSWTPLFFGYHLIGTAFFVIIAMDILVGVIIWQAYKKIKLVSLLMMPYLGWILFASYLSFYIWQYNT